MKVGFELDIIRKSLFCVFILFGAVILHAEKVAEFPELMQPVRITIDGNEMYIVDGRTKIEVYSVSEQKLLREISKSGQGPGEFRYLPFLKIFPDSVFLGAYNKIMVFSKEGKLTEEKRLYPIAKAFPVEDNYVSFGTEREGEDIYRTVNLLGSDMRKIKELHSHLRIRRKGGINPIQDYMDFDTLGDKIFIADSREGFVIEVFCYLIWDAAYEYVQCQGLIPSGMDDGFDYAVPVVFNQIECLLGFFQAE